MTIGVKWHKRPFLHRFAIQLSRSLSHFYMLVSSSPIVLLLYLTCHTAPAMI